MLLFERKLSIGLGAFFLGLVLCAVALLDTGCGDGRFDVGKIDYPYTHEYAPGSGVIKGSVNVKKFTDIDPRFDIGANEEGYAVFKDPGAAFTVLCEKYSDAIEAIRSEFNLDPITPENYRPYGVYGWQTTKCDEKMYERTSFVSGFFDIFENSFEEKDYD